MGSDISTRPGVGQVEPRAVDCRQQRPSAGNAVGGKPRRQGQVGHGEVGSAGIGSHVEGLVAGAERSGELARSQKGVLDQHVGDHHPGRKLGGHRPELRGNRTHRRLVGRPWWSQHRGITEWFLARQHVVTPRAVIPQSPGIADGPDHREPMGLLSHSRQLVRAVDTGS